LTRDVAFDSGGRVYPPLEDLAPKRAAPAMTADERLKLTKELIAARDRQAPGASR
jgi:hypothetical protein